MDDGLAQRDPQVEPRAHDRAVGVCHPQEAFREPVGAILLDYGRPRALFALDLPGVDAVDALAARRLEGEPRFWLSGTGRPSTAKTFRTVSHAASSGIHRNSISDVVRRCLEVG